MPKTHEEWRQHLKDDLGSEGIDVELMETQLDVCLRRAIGVFNKYKPWVEWLTLGEIAGGVGTTVFTLTESEVGEVGVLDVEFADQDPYGPVVPLVSDLLLLQWGRRGPRIYFQRTVDQRRMERFTGSQPDWWWNQNESALYIYSPSRPIKVMALFARQRAKWGEDIRYDEEDTFEDLALAYGKVIAANIYEQAGDTVPGPQGDIGSPAARWRDEGNETIRELKEAMSNSLRAVPPPKWVG